MFLDEYLNVVRVKFGITFLPLRLRFIFTTANDARLMQ